MTSRALGMLLVLVCGVGDKTIACTPEQRREAVIDLSKTAACVLTSIAEGGIDDPSRLIHNCEGSTLQEIEQLTGEWLAQTTVSDAAPPPMAQASPLHARFALVHQRAQAALDGGAP